MAEPTQDPTDAQAPAEAENAADASAPQGGAPSGEGVEVQSAQMPDVAPSQARGPAGGAIDVLLGTKMTVTARLGEVEMNIRDVLQLGPGSVLKLDKEAGQPIELYLRGIPFATGDLVVVGHKLAVRVKEILAAPDQSAEG